MRTAAASVALLLQCCLTEAFASGGSFLRSTSLKQKQHVVVPARLSMIGDLRGGRAPTALNDMKRQYMDALESQPLVTKSSTSAVICGLGDVLCQLMKAGSFAAFRGSFDLKRSVLFASMGFVYLAPLAHYWFGILEQKLGVSAVDAEAGGKSGPKLVQALKMLFVDQAIGAPLVNAGFLFAYAAFTTLVSGRGLRTMVNAGVDKVQTTLWPTLIASWKLWPLANFINFLVIPPQLRVLYLNVIGVAWNIVLSALAN